MTRYKLLTIYCFLSNCFESSWRGRVFDRTRDFHAPFRTWRSFFFDQRYSRGLREKFAAKINRHRAQSMSYHVLNSSKYCRRAILAREIVFMLLIASYVLWNVHARMKIECFIPALRLFPFMLHLFSFFSFNARVVQKDFYIAPSEGKT